MALAQFAWRGGKYYEGEAMKRLSRWILALGGFLFATAFGLWSQTLFTQAESVHFSVNFPSDSGQSGAKTMACCDLGGPWAQIPEQEWEGYPAGGVLVWGTEGCIVLDLGREGRLKRIVQPGFINLSTHWLRNVGVQPYQILLDMDLCGFETEWETHETSWDPLTKTSTRMIEPGEVFNMDWYFHVPEERFNQPIVCQGGLEVFDAETGVSLSKLPINIINSSAQ